MNTCLNYTVAASCGNIVKVWDPLGSSNRPTKDTFFTDSHSVETLAWSSNGEVLAYAGNSRVISLKKWKERNEKSLEADVSRSSAIRRLCFGYDNKSLIAGCQNGTVLLWNSSTERIMTTIKDTACEITSLSISKTPQSNAFSLAFANAAGDVNIYQVENFVASKVGKISDSALCSKTCSTFSPYIPGGQLFLACGNKKGQITVWDASTRYSYFAKTIHKGWVTDLCFAGRCDQLLSSSSDGTFCRIDLRSSEVDMISFDDAISCLSLHADCKTIALGNQNGEITVKDLRKMKDSIVTCFVHPDSARLTVSSLMWQQILQHENHTKEDSIPIITPSKPSELRAQNSKSEAGDFPFSPVKTDGTTRKDTSMKAFRTVDTSRDFQQTVHQQILNGSAHSPLRSPLGASRPVASVQEQGAKTTQRLSPITEDLGRKPTSMSFLTPHKNKQSDNEGDLKIRFDVRSVDRPQKLQNSTQTLSTPHHQYNHRALTTPSRRRNRNAQKQQSKELVLRSDRKRPRKSGSFSDFVAQRCTTPDPTPSEEDTPSMSAADTKQMEEYWKTQYMQLREDFLTMHFELMKEMRMQAVDFALKYEKLEKQHEDTNARLNRLTKLIEQRLNDSISFI